ncbi:MAG TPA: hypothetical protein VGJ87_03155 [Roseiflexaceae bacterium]|jgi:hypothetical protein
MSNPIPHPALQHLQLTFTVAEYEALLHTYTHVSFGPSKDARDYWEKVPNYLIARCPLCGAPYTGKLDTHSLAGYWGTHPEYYGAVYSEHFQQIGCTHFLAVQTFVNLNGLIPTELTYYASKLDVPFVIPLYVPDDIPSYAVMHSLPICRIEQQSFVPRYAVYMITYYSTEPKTLWNRRLAENEALGAGDPDYRGPIMYTSGEARADPETWDLRLWVARGKLRWLDPYAPDLALKAGPAEELPYVDIEGYRRPFTIRRGKLQLY